MALFKLYPSIFGQSAIVQFKLRKSVTMACALGGLSIGGHNLMFTMRRPDRVGHYTYKNPIIRIMVPIKASPIISVPSIIPSIMDGIPLGNFIDRPHYMKDVNKYILSTEQSSLFYRSMF